MIDLIFVNHFSLFHTLDRDYLSGLYMSTYSDLTKSTTADDGKRFKISGRYLLSHFSVQFRLLMQNVLFYQFLLCTGKVEFLHFMLKYIPGLFSVWFVFFQFLVFWFDVSFGRFCTVLHPFGDLASLGISPGCSTSASGSIGLTLACSSLTGCLLLLLSILLHLGLRPRFGRLLILCFVVDVLTLMHLLLLLLLHF